MASLFSRWWNAPFATRLLVDVVVLTWLFVAVALLWKWMS